MLVSITLIRVVSAASPLNELSSSSCSIRNHPGQSFQVGAKLQVPNLSFKQHLD